MADQMNLRSAFHGFNRQDVLACIAQLNHDHKAQLQEQSVRVQELEEENLRLAALVRDLDAQIAGLKEENAAQKAEIAELAAAQAQAVEISNVSELEIYRRAERAEREARERAAKVCRQTNAVLDDVAQKVDETTSEMTNLMQNWVEAAENAHAVLKAAAETIESIRPQE